MTNKEENIDAENIKKRPRLFRITFFTVVLFTAFVILLSARIFRAYNDTKEEPQYLSLFSEMISLVKSDYVEKVNPGEKFPGAFSWMLNSLDKYSTYLDKTKTGIYKLYHQNKACGPGIYGMKSTGYFLITDVEKNSPAEKSGIKPGNIIRAIDGKSIFGWTYWQMYLSLMTEKPTPIDLVIVRENTDKPQEIKLQTQYPTNELRIQKIEKNITHVELTRIDDDQVKILKSRLAQDYLENKLLKLIIDLRKYEGGDIEPFIELTTIFFNRTISLTLKLKNETESYTLGTYKTPDYQAVVIIDKSTMMYGELLATLFKTYGAKDKITLVGNKTRGFTSKMIQIPLNDGSSILLTEGLFLIEGKNPPKTGVIPDIEIKGDEAPTIIDRSIAILNKTHD